MALCFAAAWAALSVTQPEPEPPTAVEPTLPSLSVQVLDQSGAVPTDCAGTLTLRVESGHRLDRDSTLLCGADGRISWSDLEPGTWRLAVAGEGTELREEDHEVSGPVDLGAWTLGPGGNVSGVVSRAGEPLLGAQIRTKTGHRSVSITDGQYVLRGLPVGEVEVFAGHEDHGASGRTVVVLGEVANLDLELEPVAAKGVIGVLFETTDEGLLLTRVHPGGPARELSPGEHITAVDGYDTRDLAQSEATSMLSGAPGTAVELAVGGREISLVRVDLANLP